MTTVFLSAFSFVFAANIGGTNSTANLEIDNTDVDFDCEGCDVTVTDTEMQGTIWGESLGWVNLQPADGGVENTRFGVLTGTAWGATSGWVDFTGVFIDPATGDFSGTANSQNRGAITFECPGSSCVNTDWRSEGCINPEANNYDETAAVDDGSCIVEGCTNPSANNYDETATVDDGSCLTGGQQNYGCTDSNASNYSPSATIDNGSCSYSSIIEGCTNPQANNYDEKATVDDGSCEYDEDIIQGCMNPDAENYNADAVVDDGSCVCGADNCEDFFGCTDPEAINYDPEASILLISACEYEGGDGCTDPNADNYDLNATANNGSCVYTIYGCEDIGALNYNPNVTHDDGSCLFGFGDVGCTNPNAINYNPNISQDNGTCVIISDNVDFEIPTFDFNSPNEEEVLDIENTNQPTLGESIENIILNTPGVSEVSFIVDRYIKQETPLMRLLALALLLSSLLQILPLREGNFLLSLFGFYKTKKYWGTVYDSETKQPLDPAYVTLFDESGQVIDTSITDIDGRYNFIVGPGNYYLSAQKTDYQFPSKKLEGKSHDELYTHLYFGGAVTVSSQDTVLSVNIPMDRLNFNWNEYEKRKNKVTHFYRPWYRFLSVLATVAFITGFSLAVWVFVASQTLFAFMILSFYVLATILRLIGFRHFPRGYVKDEKGFAMPFSIVRVYSAELRREVKHTVVAEGGHYLLLVSNGTYYMIVERKLPSGEYAEAYRTQSFKVRQGFIAKKIRIKK